MTKLNNKVIVVTGGKGLLGTSIINDIFENGGIAVSLDINSITNEDLSEIQCDITNEAQINEVLIKIIAKYGRIDGLVNNAYPRTKDWGLKFENIPYSSWKENVDLQLNSVFIMIQKISEVMKSQNSGSIVNIASIYGVIGPDFSVYGDTNMTMPAAYSAIKGGVINFTRYMASYLGPHQVRVNCLSPGGIFDNQNDQFVKAYERKVPMGRMGLPKDISPTVSFLLSESSGYITGQNIIIDGGWTCI